jgi:DNA-binding transcriptional LysR family regulator
MRRTSCRSASSKTATPCFTTPANARAPRTPVEYLAAEHVTVVYEPHRRLDIDQWLADRGRARRFVAAVPSFAGVPAFIQGSTRLTTLPSLLRAQLLRGLALAPVPLPCPPMPMYLIWHLRHQADPLHQWLREQVQAVVPEVLPELTPPPATTAPAQPLQ